MMARTLKLPDFSDLTCTGASRVFSDEACRGVETTCHADVQSGRQMELAGIQEELGKLFGQQGIVRDLWVSQKKGSRNSTGGLFGVVRMAAHQEALVAKKELHGTAFNGKLLSVKWASNQRVLWVGQLGPTVTNEVLETAFVQFGALERSVVVANPETGISRRYGIVAFEGKEDATRALSMCNSNLFIIGTAAQPAEVELAWLDDSDEGFTEEMSNSSKRGHDARPAPPVGVPSHFAQVGTLEYNLAVQLKELRGQYKIAKQRLTTELTEGAQRLLGTGMPLGSLPLLSQLHFSQAALPQSSLAVQAPRPAPWVEGEDGRQQSRRNDESFHDVAPPRKFKRGSYDEFRFNPRPGDALPPDLVTAGSKDSCIQQPLIHRSAFVRGGELHTTEDEPSVSQPPAEPAHHFGHGQNSQPPLPEEPEEDGRIPGMKAPGRHDHQGIGFSAPPFSARPPDQVYQLGMPQQQPGYSQSYHHQQGLPPSTPPQPQQHFQPHSPLQQHFQARVPQQPFSKELDAGANPGIIFAQSGYGQGGFGGAAVQGAQPLYMQGHPDGGRSGMAWGHGRGYGRGQH